jgi:hypothetical protein
MLKNASSYFNSREVMWKNARKGLVHACKFPQDTFSAEGVFGERKLISVGGEC